MYGLSQILWTLSFECVMKKVVMSGHELVEMLIKETASLTIV